MWIKNSISLTLKNSERIIWKTKSRLTASQWESSKELYTVGNGYIRLCLRGTRSEKGTFHHERVQNGLYPDTNIVRLFSQYEKFRLSHVSSRASLGAVIPLRKVLRSFIPASKVLRPHLATKFGILIGRGNELRIFKFANQKVSTNRFWKEYEFRFRNSVALAFPETQLSLKISWESRFIKYSNFSDVRSGSQ